MIWNLSLSSGKFIFLIFFPTFFMKLFTSVAGTIVLTMVCLSASTVVHSQTPCIDGMADIYPCSNVDLLAFIPLSEMGDGANTNDIWGWVSPNTGKEYALVGCSNGTAFMDVTNPITPVYLGLLPTHTNSNLWRDLETYMNYCFIVSEAPDHGMQIFDLLQLDAVVNTPVEFDETAHYNLFGNCHTINIDTTNGFAYCNGTSTFDGGLHIVNIQNPPNPTLAGGYSLLGYTHDSFVWTYDGPDPDHQGKQLVFAFNGDEFAIVDCTDKLDCSAIGTYDYPDLGYVHQGWVTKDKRFFLINDELDEVNLGNDQIPYGTRTHIFDCFDLDDATYMGFHETENTSIDHNLYIQDHFVYQSNYRSGLRIFDAINISNIELNEVAYFDLFPMNDFAAYSGTWSNYQFLPSGINIATSMYAGLFITKPSIIQLSQDKWDLCGIDQIDIEVTVNADLAFPLQPTVTGIPGSVVTSAQLTEPGTVTVMVSGLNAVEPGSYMATLELVTNFGEKYELPLDIVISENSPQAPLLVNVPDNGFVSDNQSTVIFSWQEVTNATSYMYQLATDELFGDIIESQIVINEAYNLNFNLPIGQYYWRVRSMNQCGQGEWSETFSFNVDVVGIDEVATQTFQLSPNPVSDILNIRFAGEHDSNIVLTDISGKIVKSIGAPSHLRTLSIDTGDVESGIYTIRCGQFTSRFIKQ